MTYEEFKTAMEEKIRDLAPGKVVQVFPITKNNGTPLDAVTVSDEGQLIAPTFYFQVFYEGYMRGVSIDELSRELVERSEEYKPGGRLVGEFDPDIPFEKIKDNIHCKLINGKLNQDLLADVPYERIMDLALIYYFTIPVRGFENGYIIIHNDMLENWGVSDRELSRIAHGNTMRDEPPVLLSVSDRSGFRWVPPYPEMSFEEVVERAEEGSPLPMYILTTKDAMFGAVSLVDPRAMDLMHRLTNHYRANIFLIPSSIHEMMLVPDNGDISLEGMMDIIADVNHRELAGTEILSDHPYMYAWEEDRLMALGL